MEAMYTAPYDKSKSHPSALPKNRFAVSNWDLFKSCLSREWTLVCRNSFLYIFRTCQVRIILIILVGMCFLYLLVTF